MRGKFLTGKFTGRILAAIGLVALWGVIIFFGNQLLQSRVSNRAAVPTAVIAASGEDPSAQIASNPVGANGGDVVLLPEAADTQSPVAMPPAQATPTTSAPPASSGDGTEVSVSPDVQSVAWFASGSENRSVGDSFLHAGYFEDQAFVSLIRFDLSAVPRGAELFDVSLQISGLRADRLSDTEDGIWSAQLLADNGDSFVRLDFQTVFNFPAAISLLPTLRKQDLGAGIRNEWQLGPTERAWIADQLIAGKTSILVRLTGPTSGDASLYSWDSGNGAVSGGTPPVLRLGMGAAPATPPPLPTPRFVVATATPTPANILTVAANAQSVTKEAIVAAINPQEVVRVITPTPPAANVATAQAAAYLMGLPAVVESTPVPGNAATVTARELYATAVAMTTGTFTPVPPDAVTPIIIQPTPQPENALTAVAQFATATAVSALGTPTALPYNAVMATLTPTPLLIAATETPQTAATAYYQVVLATAEAQTTGTATPLPPMQRLWCQHRRPIPTSAAIARLPGSDHADCATHTNTGAQHDPSGALRQDPLLE
ncbi:MAG: hypothetical protein R2856_28635 [Caldilineaceae bacterium]